MLALVRGTAPPDTAADLQRHLDQCSSCQELCAILFDGTAVSPELLDSGARSSRRGAVILESGAMLGKYCIKSVIGAGAMGIVYLAEDPNLHRSVAIKVLRNQREEASSRLMREAQALARISHPNVIVVHEVGTVADQVFMAMEFVEGCSLTAWLESSPRSTAEILSHFDQAGRGLVVAHAAELVHRDFKPDNVLVGKDGRVRVVDFGLAREDVALSTPTQATESDATDIGRLMTLTQTGAFIGTPAYMAPEQYEGKRADARSDQFSFAVALFEALYGQRPYRGNTLNQLSLAVRSGNISIPKTTRRIPRHVDRALLRALSVDASNRFPSMESMLDALVEKERKETSPKRAKTVGFALTGLLLAASVAAYGVIGTRASSVRATGDARTSEAPAPSVVTTSLPSASALPSAPHASVPVSTAVVPLPSVHAPKSPATVGPKPVVSAATSSKPGRDLFDTTR